MSAALTLEAERELVLAAVARHEPATAEEIRCALGQPWEKRGTVRNRLYELRRAKLIISDDSWPMRFAINQDTEL